MKSGEESLIRIAAEMAGVPLVEMERLIWLMLAKRSGTKSYGSKLNNDGSPLQICETCTTEKHFLRIIGDPGADLLELHSRYDAACDALFSLMYEVQAISLLPILEKTVRLSLPEDPTPYSELAQGILWLGASPRSSGLAVYLNARWGSEDSRWPRVRNWLASTLSEKVKAERVLSNLSMHAEVVSLGLEGSELENARAKIYFRLKPSVSLASLQLPALIQPLMENFLLSMAGEFPIRRSGLTFCLGFAIKDGSWADMKIDLCGHCISRDPAAWAEDLDTYCRSMGLLSPLAISNSVLESSEIALVGLGVHLQGDVRLNVYLKALPRQ
jgi:hypothetical protein